MAADSCYELFSFSGLLNLKRCQQPFTNCAVLFQSWNYKKWNLIFWFLSMCKLRRITHKFNIKPFGLYSICEWFAGVYKKGFMLNLWVICRSLHIDKNQKIKFHSYNENLHKMWIKTCFHSHFYAIFHEFLWRAIKATNMLQLYTVNISYGF